MKFLHSQKSATATTRKHVLGKPLTGSFSLHVYFGPVSIIHGPRSTILHQRRALAGCQRSVDVIPDYQEFVLRELALHIKVGTEAHSSFNYPFQQLRSLSNCSSLSSVYFAKVNVPEFRL